MTKPWVRKLLIAFGVLVVVAVGAVAWLVATFDANAYKGLAIDWMKTERQRTLVIDGPVELSVIPRLGVKLSGVTLSEHRQAAEFAHIDEVSLSAALWPLLRGELQVDRVEASGVRAVYRRTADGRTNIDDLLAKDEQPEPVSDEGQPREPLAFDIEGLRFEKLSLTVDDELAKLKGSVAVALFSTGRLTDRKETPVELDLQVALDEPAVRGQLKGKTALSFDLKARSVALREMALAWAGDAVGVRALDMRLNGALAYDGAAGTVAADDLDLRFGATLGELKLADSQLEIDRFAYDPAKRLVALDELELKLAGTNAGQALSLSLDWPQLSVSGETLTGGPLSGAASLKGDTAFEASFKSAAPRGTFERIELPGLETTLKGGSGPRKVSGTLRADLVVDAAKKAGALEALAAQLRLEEPSLQPLALDFTGRASASADAAQWALKGSVNANPFETDGRVRLDAKPIHITAAARFDALDLNRLLPPEKAGAPASGASAPGAGGAGDDAPLDLSALRALQGRFDLRAGSLAYRQYRATNLEATARIDNGVLNLSPFQAGIWGGRLDMSATADAGANRVGARGAAQGIDIAALLKDVASKDLLEGRGRLSFDLRGQGKTTGALKRSLDGSAGLQLRDGAIKGINLASKLRQVRAAIASPLDASARAVTTEKTDFSELSASFAVADGVARSNDLAMKSPFLRLGGEGAVDIGQGRIDYTVRATVAETSKGQGGAELAELRGVTVPVRLTGPLDAIDWQIRWSAVAADLVKSKVGQQVEDKLRDKLGDKLGLPPRGASAPAGAASKPEDLLKQRLRGLLK